MELIEPMESMEPMEPMDFSSWDPNVLGVIYLVGAIIIVTLVIVGVVIGFKKMK